MFVTSETMQGPECKELRLLRFNISGLKQIWVRSIIIKGLGAICRYRNKVKLNFNVGT